jgi:U3 small nucleolar RNA-associated protein 14
MTPMRSALSLRNICSTLLPLLGMRALTTMSARVRKSRPLRRGAKSHESLMHSLIALLRLLSDLSQFAASGKARKERVRDEPALESEYNMLPAEGGGGKGGTVTLAQLARTLDDQQSTKTALERLAKKGPTPASLGTATVERLERTVAYKQAASALGRWDAPVQANRAKRTQRFGDDDDYKATLPSIATLNATYEPTTALEQAVAQAVLPESHVKAYEDLATRALTKDGTHTLLGAARCVVGKTLSPSFLTTHAEVAARNAQLAKMRSMLFFDELKARRKRLIKSKKYRKLHKRREETASLSVEELRVLQGEEAAQQRALELEKARVLERVTMRHRNTGAWAKGALRKAAHKDGTREAIQEQVRYCWCLTRTRNNYCTV